jgi:hypothetical protein
MEQAGHEGAIWSTNKMPFKEWEMELQFKVALTFSRPI